MSLASLVTGFVRRHWKAYAASAVMLVGVAVCSILVPRKVGAMIDGLAAHTLSRQDLMIGIAELLSFLRAYGNGVLDRTSRLATLHLDLSRATVEHSSNAMRQLLAVRDPRDLLTIGAQSQHQLRTVFDYGQELFNIAAGLRGAALQAYGADAPATPATPATPALAAPAHAVESAVAAVQEAVQETVTAAAPASEPAAASFAAPSPDAAPAPLADVVANAAPDADAIVTSRIVPPLEPTAIAKATSDILDMPLMPHPVAASVAVDVDVEIELPKVAPVDATPPLAQPSNGAPKVTEIRSGRGRKKNS